MVLGNPYMYPDAVRRLAHRLYEVFRFSFRKVAAMLDVSSSTVHRWVTSPRGPNPAVTPSKKQRRLSDEVRAALLAIVQRCPIVTIQRLQRSLHASIGVKLGEKAVSRGARARARCSMLDSRGNGPQSAPVQGLRQNRSSRNSTPTSALAWIQASSSSPWMSATSQNERSLCTATRHAEQNAPSVPQRPAGSSAPSCWRLHRMEHRTTSCTKARSMLTGLRRSFLHCPTLLGLRS